MCRNIKPLFNFDPPTTEEEIRAAALQFVRKISGFTKPSKSNEAPFFAAIDDIAGISARLIQGLETVAPPKNREEETAKLRAKSLQRFGATTTGTFAAKTGLTITHRPACSRMPHEIPAYSQASNSPGISLADVDW